MAIKESTRIAELIKKYAKYDEGSGFSILSLKELSLIMKNVGKSLYDLISDSILDIVNENYKKGAFNLYLAQQVSKYYYENRYEKEVFYIINTVVIAFCIVTIEALIKEGKDNPDLLQAHKILRQSIRSNTENTKYDSASFN